jgi:hypothetical protein
MRRHLAVILLAVLALAAPAAAAGTPRVLVVPPFPLERYAGQGAVGLLAPGAGETVTREGALASLLAGKVRSSLLGGVPPGARLLRLGEGSGPTVYVSLPPPGRSSVDRRYPIAVVGEGFHGLLTSDSTRIPGLVSVADVATGKLRWQADDHAVATLERLDRRIDRNNRWRLWATIAAATALIAAGTLRPRWGPRALLLALALNLWLSPWLAAAAALLALALPLGAACAAVLAAYLVSMGLDAQTVALSPLGPSQAGRFFGVDNLIETLLLAAGLLGAARLGRAGIAVAALALVAVAGNRFGADGGGLVVLLAGFLALALRLRGAALTPRRLALVAAGAIALGLVLVGFDAATGGHSHVTRAVGDGPGALARDVGDRLEVSVRRTVYAPGPAFVVLVALAGLAVVATRRPRRPVTDALLVALVVSLLVNDTPSDVLGIGAAAAFALRRFEGSPSGVAR